LLSWRHNFSSYAGESYTTRLKGPWWLSLRHHFGMFSVAIITWSTATEYLCHGWQRLSTVCRSQITHFRSLLIIGFATWITHLFPLMEQGLLNHLKHISSSWFLVVFVVIIFFIFCLVFCVLFSFEPSVLRYTTSY